MVTQFDHLVEQDPDGGHAHPVGHREHGSYFVQSIATGQGTDVIQSQSRGHREADLVHQEVGERLHALGSASHADELRRDGGEMVRRSALGSRDGDLP